MTAWYRDVEYQCLVLSSIAKAYAAVGVTDPSKTIAFYNSIISEKGLVRLVKRGHRPANGFVSFAEALADRHKFFIYRTSAFLRVLADAVGPSLVLYVHNSNTSRLRQEALRTVAAQNGIDLKPALLAEASVTDVSPPEIAVINELFEKSRGQTKHSVHPDVLSVKLQSVDSRGQTTDIDIDPDKYASTIEMFRERQRLFEEYRAPVSTESSVFCAIWSVIRDWDIGIPLRFEGYRGGQGDDVQWILDNLALQGVVFVHDDRWSEALFDGVGVMKGLMNAISVWDICHTTFPEEKYYPGGDYHVLLILKALRRAGLKPVTPVQTA